MRGQSRDAPPNFVSDIASLHRDNPAKITQVKYTGIRNKAANAAARQELNPNSHIQFDDVLSYSTSSSTSRRGRHS